MKKKTQVYVVYKKLSLNIKTHKLKVKVGSNYMTFWKTKNYGNSKKKNSYCQGLGGERD